MTNNYPSLDWPGIQAIFFYHPTWSFSRSVGSMDYRKVSHSLQLLKLTSRSSFKDFENIVFILPYYKRGKLSKKHS